MCTQARAKLFAKSSLVGPRARKKSIYFLCLLRCGISVSPFCILTCAQKHCIFCPSAQENSSFSTLCADRIFFSPAALQNHTSFALTRVWVPMQRFFAIACYTTKSPVLHVWVSSRAQKNYFFALWCYKSRSQF